MFNSLIDIIVRREHDRDRIILLLIRVLLTASLAFHFFPIIFGPFEVLNVTDFKSIVTFLLDGTAILALGLFYCLWVVFYDVLDYLLTVFAIWTSMRMLQFAEVLVKGNHDGLVAKLESSAIHRKIARIYLKMFTFLDFIDTSPTNVRPGKEFYRFYTYLWELEKDRKDVERREFSNVLLAALQFMLLYQFLEVPDLGWMNFSVLFFAVFLIFMNFMLYLLTSFVAFKHHKLLGLMMIIEPLYDPEARTLKQATSQPGA